MLELIYFHSALCCTRWPRGAGFEALTKSVLPENLVESWGVVKDLADSDGSDES
jgi:hypothetical protein